MKPKAPKKQSKTPKASKQVETVGKKYQSEYFNNDLFEGFINKMIYNALNKEFQLIQLNEVEAKKYDFKFVIE